MAHKLPSTDTFGDNAIENNGGPRWTEPTLYWPTLLWNSGTTDPTGFALTPDWGGLHDGYTGISTSMSLPRAQDLGRRSHVFVLRNDQRTDSTLEGEFVFTQVGGSSDFYIENFFCGLGSRIQGAAGCDFQAQSRYAEALRAPTGYWFVLMSRWTGSASTLGFAILHVTGPSSPGGASAVEQLIATTYSVNGQTILTRATPFKIRFGCTTNGGVVELRGFFTDPTTGVETEVLSYDDGSGALLTEGHAGFLLTSEMDSASSTHEFVNGISAFEIQDSGGTIVVRDEFSRTHVNQMDEVGPDKFGTTGNVITGSFTGDQAGKSISGELPDFKDRLLRHASVEKLEIDNTPDGGWHLATDPASNPYVQASAADIEYGAGSSVRIVGVCVRASITGAAAWSDFSGSTGELTAYIASLRYDGSVFALRIHTWSPTLGRLRLCNRILNKSGDPVTIGVTDVRTLRLDVENRDGQNAATGNVHLSPTINGFKFTEWTNLLAGVIEEDDGTLTDTRTDRILSGEAQGFFASGPGTDDVFVHKYDRPAVTFELDEKEQASITLGNEQDGVSGTLVLNHEWSVKTRYIAYGEAIRYGSGHIHTHATAEGQRRAWKIKSDAAKLSEVNGLLSFFLTQEALKTPFNWVIPDGESVIVMHGADSIKYSKISKGVYTFEVELTELIAN